MTLIETLVAVTILTVAIVAPMSLTMQSLSSAYYARDQVTAFNLAQEAIESVRSIRDGNILKIALNTTSTCASDSLPIYLPCGIPTDGRNFTIDTRNNIIADCPSNVCPPLQTDDNPSTPQNEGTLYGYQSEWVPTVFTRAVQAESVTADEVRITVTVTRSGNLHAFPPVVLRENLYRWVADSSAI